MSTSSAPEPLPLGVQPLKVVAEPASPPFDPSGASRQRRTGPPLTLVQGGQRRQTTAPRPQTPEEPPEEPEPTAQELASARQRARRQLPPPAAVAKEVAMALFEVEAGYRSAAQLERVCTPELWDRLEHQVRRHGGPLPSGRKLIRVHYQELIPGVANTVAVVERGPRVQPVAMRLDARSGRWLVTELWY
jgi:hypothetical protein